MRRALLGLLALTVGCSASARSQEEPPPLAYTVFGLIQPAPRAALGDRYRSLAQSPYAHEYAFCAISLPDSEGTPNVVSIMFPTPDNSGPNFVVFSCPKGAIYGHAHPPASCGIDSTVTPRDTTCRFGDAWGYQCAPSKQDVAVARRRHAAVEMVQCDEHAFAFFSPIPLALIPLGPIKPPRVPMPGVKP